MTLGEATRDVFTYCECFRIPTARPRVRSDSQEVDVATVTVLTFSSSDTAADALHIVHNLEKQHAITLIDAGLISWPPGQKSPTTKLLRPPLLAMAIKS